MTEMNGASINERTACRSSHCARNGHRLPACPSNSWPTHAGAKKPSPLTSRQAEVLRLMIEAWPLPVTTRDLAEVMGLRSRYTTWLHVKALERKGYIECSFGRSGQKILRYPDGTEFGGQVPSKDGHWPLRLWTRSGLELRLVHVFAP